MQILEKISKTIQLFIKNWIYIILILYILFILIYSFYFIKSDGENVLLASNELGDFLAGFFSPIAFLFLVLGYIQQGKELRQNTDALKLQVEELKQNVIAQNKLVQIQQQELESKHFSVRPYLIFDQYKISVNRRQDSIYNEDGEAIDISDEIYYELDVYFRIFCQVNNAYGVRVINNYNNSIESQLPQISQGNSEIVILTLHESQVDSLVKNDEFDLLIHIEYFDSYGKSLEQKINFHIYQFDWSLEYAMIRMQILNN